MGLDELVDNVALIRRMRYWDLFILTRTLVDLSHTFEAAVGEDGLGSLDGPLASWDEEPPEGLKRAHEEMADPLVAIVLHAMRRYLNRTFATYDKLSHRPDVGALRDQAIDLHYSAFDEAVAFARACQGSTTSEQIEALADRWSARMSEIADAPAAHGVASSWS
jgi:hypothetical protein